MNTKLLVHKAVASVFLVIVLFAAAACDNPDIERAEQITAAKKTPEARLFLKKFPASTVETGSRGSQAVDFLYKPESGENSYVKLRVFVINTSDGVSSGDCLLEHRNGGRTVTYKDDEIIPALKKGLK